MENIIKPALAFALALAVIIVLWFSIPSPQPPPPANISFEVTLPQDISPLHEVEGVVKVVNTGGSSAQKLEVLFESESVELVEAESYPKLEPGGSATVKLRVKGKDVEDGLYSAFIWIRYVDPQGTHETSKKEVSFYIVPSVKFIDVAWETISGLVVEQPKNVLGKSDTTSIKFKVRSDSKHAFYYDLKVVLKPAIGVPGLSITPASITIEALGPGGVSREYEFNITTSDTPPGAYELVIYLYSKDGRIAQQLSIKPPLIVQV